MVELNLWCYAMKWELLIWLSLDYEVYRHLKRMKVNVKVHPLVSRCCN